MKSGTGMTRIAVCAAFVAATLSLGGCAGTSGIEASGKKSWNLEGAPELTKKVIVNNSGLAGDVEIVDIKNAMAGDLLRAQVSLKSRDGDTLPLQYKFDWFDAQGMELPANIAWKPLLIQGKETKTIQAVAPDPRAQEFKLKLREPDKD